MTLEDTLVSEIGDSVDLLNSIADDATNGGLDPREVAYLLNKLTDLNKCLTKWMDRLSHA